MSETATPNRVVRTLVLLFVFAVLAFGLPAFLRLIGAHDWLSDRGLGGDAFTYLFIGTGVVLIVLVTMALRRMGPLRALTALAVFPFAPRGLALVVVALAVMAFTASWLGHPFNPPTLGMALSLGVVGPFAEELLFRGFVFRQGRDWAGLPFWSAAILSSLLFGIGHLGQGDSLRDSLTAAGITFVGGLIFCWLVERWGSLWPAIALHAGMDLLWFGFGLGSTAIGGSVGNAARLGALAVVVLGTLILTRRQKAT